MPDRPFRDRERRFPIFDRPTLVGSSESEDDEDEIPHFDSVEDLPDSPMLERYIEQVSEYLDMPKDEVINTQPVRDYMRELGVWELAKRQNE